MTIGGDSSSGDIMAADEMPLVLTSFPAWGMVRTGCDIDTTDGLEESLGRAEGGEDLA